MPLPPGLCGTGEQNHTCVASSLPSELHSRPHPLFNLFWEEGSPRWPGKSPGLWSWHDLSCIPAHSPTEKRGLWTRKINKGTWSSLVTCIWPWSLHRGGMNNWLHKVVPWPPHAHLNMHSIHNIASCGNEKLTVSSATYRVSDQLGLHDTVSKRKKKERIEQCWCSRGTF